MPLAANTTSFRICPASDGPKPHGSGAAVSGSPSVNIEQVPALRQGDGMICSNPTDKVTGGSATVYINGAPAARIGDACAHGGTIATGCGTVWIN